MTDDELRAYIHAKVQESRKAKGTKERVHSIVRFESQQNVQWREKALADLESFENKSIWAEVYIRCGRCKREWDAWLLENPVSDLLDEWVEKARAVVTENRWV